MTGFLFNERNAVSGQISLVIARLGFAFPRQRSEENVLMVSKWEDSSYWTGRLSVSVCLSLCMCLYGTDTRLSWLASYGWY